MRGNAKFAWIGLLLVAFVPILTVTPLQAATTPTATFSVPTGDRAPCDGESTRTPTPTASTIPTLDLRTPTPTATSTHYPLFVRIPLIWPPNCAILHSAVLPDFQFDTFIGGPFAVTLSLRGPVNRMISYNFLVGNNPTPSTTPDHLPDGDYQWQVTSVKFDNLAGQSEVWVFRSDTSCHCTDTPMPTPTLP